MLVERVQKSSRLYTSEYHIHKIITHSDKVKAEGTFLNKKFSVNLPLGERRVAIPLNAVVKAYIDFSDFNEKNVKKGSDGKITIILPDPRIVLTGTKVNHKEMKQYVAFTRHNFSDAELTSYEQQGRQQIVASISQMGIIEHAQESAARQLIPMLAMLGYAEKDITISFRKQFTMAEITRFIESSIIQTDKKND
ncbi:hypothetical protein JCM15124A_06520 [Prevotella falsenii]